MSRHHLNGGGEQNGASGDRFRSTSQQATQNEKYVNSRKHTHHLFWWRHGGWCRDSVRSRFDWDVERAATKCKCAIGIDRNRERVRVKNRHALVRTKRGSMPTTSRSGREPPKDWLRTVLLLHGHATLGVLNLDRRNGGGAKKGVGGLHSRFLTQNSASLLSPRPPLSTFRCCCGIARGVYVKSVPSSADVENYFLASSGYIMFSCSLSSRYIMHIYIYRILYIFK